MAFREQSALIATGNEKIIRMPDSAFSNPLAPTDIEVKAWANSYVDPNELRDSILVYHSLDGSDSNYKYVWYVIRSTSYPVDIARIKDFLNINTINVNLTPLSTEPTPSGNTTNQNEVVISSEGQHWIIDANGVATNLNKSEGDYEVTNENKGIILNTPTGRHRIKSSNQDGVLTYEKL